MYFICRRSYDSKIRGINGSIDSIRGYYIPLKFKNKSVSRLIDTLNKSTKLSYYFIKETIPRRYIPESEENIQILRNLYKELNSSQT